MGTAIDRMLVHDLRDSARALTGAPEDFDALLDLVGDAPLVLLGEASHGTHEFYRVRAAITKRLIREKGFGAVAVEGDWPDAYRVHRFVLGASRDPDAEEALGDFRRFPQWMWRNADVLDFVGWLRTHNDTLPFAQRTGFYGLDLYSLHASMEAVLRYLDVADPAAARVARTRYACFEPFGEDPQEYGLATGLGMSPSCESDVLAQLIDLRRSATAYLPHDGPTAADDRFFAEQNALVVRNAERYYRTMVRSNVLSWNLRDRHMAETVDALAAHLQAHGRSGRIIVWAHNSHLGDARATQMAGAGELNVGQLARQRHGQDAVLVGFTTFDGTVTAASDWDAPAERKHVRPALAGSIEELFHRTARDAFYLDLRAAAASNPELREPRLERAIGVIYRPESERLSHYFNTRITEQFDAVLHYDHTRAVEPLERTGLWERGEMPETYPSAL